ncbi:KaiC domain-containing protein [Sulfolobus sp. A20]|uniref:KaiC domain-containing protein n=1 Tax=Sulfolobaceae TaxID=118883 RepID=UPI000845E222|nr:MULTISPECIES: KaiC domain-containing protein [unclassified Sulfolobus]TRM74108.1 KaiC domain-containing protein [Sulfolobus sp. A20-N-F8]TRM79450.1 KaiC domain-containing protein [Sulfolobus sp. B5]TRM84625.1 KaiC domain-containing protein [Sulfolobus sp. F3]TRM88989.1 KaiC domain-containing protein [Sulfolobus sp. C3]TRM95200.1 KaiC domain-containing protein [Sulfolobus sp. A20-N-G8]TRN01859.1 KaiC domain-containing protein [Sulfolobus sp. F1]TRN04781.1 KaiC domain-containing protein [Su
MVDRVRTYIPGLDEILYGGIPERSIVLLSGGPGTGKSIAAKQFIYNGLVRDEAGIYVTLEEHPVSVLRSFKHFNWDVMKYEKDGKFAIVDAFTGGVGSIAQREKYVVKQVDSVDELSEVLRQAIKDIKATRLAIDSVSTLYLTKPAMARSVVMKLKRVISGLGCTAFFVSQVSVGERGFGGPGVEHAVDGIIRLDLDEIDGKLYRSIIVWKMRDTKISMVRHPMEIADNGIVVEWDKYLRIAPNSASILPLSKEEIEEMKKSVEQVELKGKERRVIEEEEE